MSTIERFAKIIETPTTQVLAYLEYDGKSDEHVMHQIGSSSGIRFDFALRWPGDQEGKARLALEVFDEAKANKLVTSMAQVCADSATDDEEIEG